jgi:hypothetical protein
LDSTQPDDSSGTKGMVMPKLNIHNRTGIKLQITAGLRKGAQFDGEPKVLDLKNNAYVCYNYSDDFLVTAAPKIENTDIPQANYTGKRGVKDIYVVADEDSLMISEENPD